MTGPEQQIHVIGIGDDGLAGLTEAARRLIDEAELLVSDVERLALVPEGTAERMVVAGNLEATAGKLAEIQGKRIVILASGDPLFYGVARYLCDRLGKDRLNVLPHVSAMQMAFARVKESWEEAYLTSVASRPLETVDAMAGRAGKHC